VQKCQENQKNLNKEKKKYITNLKIMPTMVELLTLIFLSCSLIISINKQRTASLGPGSIDLHPPEQIWITKKKNKPIAQCCIS
jgi:hypothetical protein